MLQPPCQNRQRHCCQLSFLSRSQQQQEIGCWQLPRRAMQTRQHQHRLQQEKARSRLLAMTQRYQLASVQQRRRQVKRSLLASPTAQHAQRGLHSPSSKQGQRWQVGTRRLLHPRWTHRLAAPQSFPPQSASEQRMSMQATCQWQRQQSQQLMERLRQTPEVQLPLHLPQLPQSLLLRRLQALPAALQLLQSMQRGSWRILTSTNQRRGRVEKLQRRATMWMLCLRA